MKTEILTITAIDQQQADINRAATILRRGGLVVFPTETVYGIGGDATNQNAAAAIYKAKGRPSDNPLIIHISHPAEAERYALTNDTYYRLAKQFMPGPLTIILPKKSTIPDTVTGGLQTVAVRCPAHPVATSLIRALGAPIAAPSANLSGKPSPTLASHVTEDLGGKVDMIIDGGPCEIGLESTIIALNGDEGILLRPGAITYDALCCVCRKVSVADSVTEMLSENERPLSPGMKYRHYAPRATLILLDGDDNNVLTFLQNQKTNKNIGMICYDEELEQLAGNATLFTIGAKHDLATQAHRLFAVLREANEHPEILTLYAHLPPKEGLGLALYNRCIRAAAHTVKKV